MSAYFIYIQPITLSICKMVENTSYFFPFFDGAVFTQSGNFTKGSRLIIFIYIFDFVLN